MKKKTYLLAMLALCGTFAFVSCGDDDPEPDNNGTEQTDPNGSTISSPEATLKVKAVENKPDAFENSNNEIYEGAGLYFEVRIDKKTGQISKVTAYAKASLDKNYSACPKKLVIPKAIDCGDKTGTVNYIGSFQGCANLEELVIPSTIEESEYEAFYGCTGLKKPVHSATFFACLPTSYEGVYKVPNGINMIGLSAFADCNKLTGVDLPEGVKLIGDNFVRLNFKSFTFTKNVYFNGNVFAECPELTTIEFGDDVTEIDGSGSLCNESCPKLTSIVFGKNLKKIAITPYVLNPDFKEVVVKSTTPPEISKKTWVPLENDGIRPTFTIRVPAQSVAAYKAHEVWGKYNNIEAI